MLIPSAANANILSTSSSVDNGPLKIMQPAPHMLAKAKSQNKLGTIKEMYSRVTERNKNVKPLPPGGAGMTRMIKSPTVAAKASSPVKPEAKALAIAVQYTDQNANTKISYFQNLLFGDKFGSMRDYYRTVSNGDFVVDGKVVGSNQDTVFLTLPHNKNYYANNSYGMDGAYPNNAQGLVADAVQALISANFDWTPYENTAGVVPYLFVIHSGAGAETTNDNTDIWSCRWSLDSHRISVGNIQINDFTLEPELTLGQPSTVGVYAHEFGHNLGLPDLYDINYVTEGVGDWSIMGSGSWAGPDGMGEVPVEFDAWSKSFLGWITPEVVPNGTSAEEIPKIEGTGGKVLKLNTPESDEYFLIENRQKTSYDQYMDGSGLLIWHIDSAIADPNSIYWQRYNTVNSSGDYSPPHHGVYVVEADGGNELDSARNTGDAGDPFPGSSNVRTLKGTGQTDPNLTTWDGQENNLSITSISNTQDVMTATFTAGTPEVSKVTALKAEPSSISLTKGEKKELSLIATYSDGRNVEVGASADWKSSNEKCATVQVDSSTGLVNITAVAKGRATVSASFGGKKVNIPVIVTPVAVGLQASPETVSLQAGKRQSVKVKLVYDDGTTEDVTKAVQWVSEDETTAKMTTLGIQGVGIGETTITGKYNDNFSVSISVKVTLPVKKLTTNQTTLNLVSGGTGTINLTAIYKDDTNEDVTGEASWKSSNSKIAQVDSKGVVTAVAKGTTTITASFGGKTVISRVKVT
jgi:M6 family metalloprotease domain